MDPLPFDEKCQKRSFCAGDEDDMDPLAVEGPGKANEYSQLK